MKNEKRAPEDAVIYSRKRFPRVHSATEIKNWHILEEYEPNKWRPARPCECISGGIMRRFKIAWKVFNGEWDALNWGEFSGEWDNSQVDYRDITDTRWESTEIS